MPEQRSAKERLTEITKNGVRPLLVRTFADFARLSVQKNSEVDSAAVETAIAKIATGKPGELPEPRE